jgi:hypothetical protein
MAEWVYVENNEILGCYDLLPQSWRNISGLNLSKDDLPFLKSLGWYRVTKDDITYDREKYSINGYDYTLRENDVLESPRLTEIVVEPTNTDLE